MTQKRGRKPAAKYEVVCDEREFLETKGFDFSWLDTLHTNYGFDTFQYIHKFRAFRCYKEGKHLDWIDINDLALLNGKRRIAEILLKHQQVSPKRAVIQYPWR